MVPDFVGREAPTFEARTLLFLGAWLEHASANPALPLHLACIGDPPLRVQRLAARCGAILSVHAPVGAEQRGVSNKLRGFEVPRRTDFLLLVDADVMTLGDPSAILDLGRCVALSPADTARVSPAQWERIYRGLGLPFPTQRILSTRGVSMPPYYNSGVVYAPWSCDLRAIWEDHVRRIAAMFVEVGSATPSGYIKPVQGSDQAGLATAVAQLRQDGMPVALLPEGFNVRWHHIALRRVRVDRTLLYHATGLFRSRDAGSRQVPGLWDYERLLIRRVRGHTRKRRARPPLPRLVAALIDLHRIVGRLRRLHRKYVREEG
jgi:hypothetical protein